MKKIAPIVVIVVLLVGGIYYFTRTQTQSTSTTLLASKNEVTLSQLQADLQGIVPHFVDASKTSEQPLSQEDQRIKDDVITLYAERYAAASLGAPTSSVLIAAQNGIWLNAIGKRYILLTEVYMNKATDVILDVQTGQDTPISGSKKLRYYLAPEREIALYIDSQALYTYSLDHVSATLISGSELSGTETYHNGYIGGMGIEINPEETHTKNSITISVFDSSKSVPNPDVPGANMYAKVGQKTLSF